MDKKAKPTIVFHIGYPKTGTTWLQTHFLPSLPDTNFIGMDITNSKRKKPGIIEKTFSKKGVVWPPYYKYLHQISLFEDSDYSPSKFVRKLKEDVDTERINIVTSEGLIRPYSFEKTAFRISKLAETFRIKILISIRNQQDIVLSRYFHDHHIFQQKKFPKYTLKQALFENPFSCYHPTCSHGFYECLCDKKQMKSITLDQYDYFRLANIYESLLGEGSVSFFVYEHFVSARFDELCNLSNSLTSSRNEDFVQSIIGEEPKGARDQESKKMLIDFNGEELNEMQAYILSRFSYSNKLLSEKYNLSLNDKGYF
ncbi:MAG: sulfotransferase domain-containing protein [Marinoscillum sp.]|uniref:sulfotransferase domain-containing protein n=1 Tax=Marinoscillum sp. TaxID=2024838 RepID=UPI0032F91BF2